MGVCCQAGYSEDVELVDLPARKNRNGDIIAKWELKLPFSRCTFNTYAVLLKQAHRESGEKGYVT